MVVKTMAEESEDQESNNKAGNSNIKFVIVAILLSVVLSGGMVGGALYLFAGDDSEQQANADGEDEDQEEVTEAEPAEPPIYHSMDPKFVVSFRDQKKARFMQFSLEVMTRNDEVIKAIKQHNPAIRSNLLLLLDGQDSEKMITREGKEQFLLEIAENINQTLENIGGTSGVETAYYNSFVMQ
jgi:flagellar FliL protein